MYFPYITNIPRQKEMLTYFGGYNHNLSCAEGQFYDQKNITSDEFPLLSVRHKRQRCTNDESWEYCGILDTKEHLFYVAKEGQVSRPKFYIDGEEVEIYNGKSADLGTIISLTNTPKTLVKMGKDVVIFPDKVWYRLLSTTPSITSEGGYIEASAESSGDVTFQLVDSDGENITSLWTSGDPSDGAYRISSVNGKKSLQTYSATTKMWVNVPTVYFKISNTNIGKKFNKGDGVKITCDFRTISNNNYKKSNVKNIFVNADETYEKIRNSNFVIKDKGDDYITIVGILGMATLTGSIRTTVERKCPDMDFVVECQNRLWGCASDGHELYACKLGDCTNWNCFDGVSTDSWTATVGSDGKFTGAFAYMGYPLFFKEERILKITISGYGAHSYRETECRGVAEGSHKSLVLLNELLYFKSRNNVCYYDGNFPQEIGDDLGDIPYKNAIAGAIKNKYYIAMENAGKQSLFVFDVNNQIWTKESEEEIEYDFPNIVKKPYEYFQAHKGDLYAVRKEDQLYDLYSIYGTDLFGNNLTEEGKIDFMAESGWIGYEKDNKKYLSQMNLRVKQEVGSYLQLFIEYDSSGNWEHVWSVAGKGTKIFTIPVRPKRCDHFRYRLVGKGDVKIYSISKSYEEGSDL